MARTKHTKRSEIKNAEKKKFVKTQKETDTTKTLRNQVKTVKKAMEPDSPPGTPPWEEVAEQMMREWGMKDPFMKGKRKDSFVFRRDRKSPGKCGKGWELGSGGKCVRPRRQAGNPPIPASGKDPLPPSSSRKGKGVNPQLVMSGIGLAGGLGLMAYGAYDAQRMNKYIRDQYANAFKKQVENEVNDFKSWGEKAAKDWGENAWRNTGRGGGAERDSTGQQAREQRRQEGYQRGDEEYRRRYEEARRRAQERERNGQEQQATGKNSGPSFSRPEAQSWWEKTGGGQPATRQSMRKARKAAWAKVHPDLAQNPKEKARRTEQFRKVSDEFENASRALGINLDSIVRLRRDRKSPGKCGKGWRSGAGGKCARSTPQDRFQDKEERQSFYRESDALGKEGQLRRRLSNRYGAIAGGLGLAGLAALSLSKAKSKTSPHSAPSKMSSTQPVSSTQPSSADSSARQPKTKEQPPDDYTSDPWGSSSRMKSAPSSMDRAFLESLSSTDPSSDPWAKPPKKKTPFKRLPSKARSSQLRPQNMTSRLSPAQKKSRRGGSVVESSWRRVKPRRSL